jgi:uncharacterized protein
MSKQDQPAASAARSYTSFDGGHRLAAGTLTTVALSVAQALRDGSKGPMLTFDDHTGEVVDIDTRGTDAQILARLRVTPSPPASDAPVAAPEAPQPRGRGRPKLGVVAREVTLLPRHWEWLAAQTGGASVALRKLVEAARHAQAGKSEVRTRRERTYRFMSAIAGDYAGFEEATRALFAGDRLRLTDHTATWPADVREYAIHLAFGPDDTDRHITT